MRLAPKFAKGASNSKKYIFLKFKCVPKFDGDFENVEKNHPERVL
jgi:hypothetical protein